MSEDSDAVTDLKQRLDEGQDPSEALDVVSETTSLSMRDIRQRRQEKAEGSDVSEQEDEDDEEDVESALEEMADTDLSDTDDAGKFVELLKVPLFDDSDLANQFQDELNSFVTEFYED